MWRTRNVLQTGMYLSVAILHAAESLSSKLAISQSRIYLVLWKNKVHKQIYNSVDFEPFIFRVYVIEL